MDAQTEQGSTTESGRDDWLRRQPAWRRLAGRAGERHGPGAAARMDPGGVGRLRPRPVRRTRPGSRPTRTTHPRRLPTRTGGPARRLPVRGRALGDRSHQPALGRPPRVAAPRRTGGVGPRHRHGRGGATDARRRGARPRRQALPRAHRPQGGRLVAAAQLGVHHGLPVVAQAFPCATRPERPLLHGRDPSIARATDVGHPRRPSGDPPARSRGRAPGRTPGGARRERDRRQAPAARRTAWTGATGDSPASACTGNRSAPSSSSSRQRVRS